MTSILAIDTSTEACSVALSRNGVISGIHEIVPRRHSQRLLAMLQDLLPEGIAADGGLDAIAYGSGPGSFTGLRIAASAVQGLCFAAALPALPVSTLACQVQTALRLGLIGEGEAVLSTLDAHIGELYWALYQIEDGLPQALTAAAASKPEQLDLAGSGTLVAIGSGLHYLEHFRAATQERLSRRHPDLLPAARDLLPLAQHALARGQVQMAEQVCPVYVRDEISWKKIAEQGPRS
ncbi:tRNA (adenosine(37)-N6)-threonylcarbamoyltransferase complex dimerization subunit type 1 TsaB [Kineobactrum salinum]|uniref:tRNA threonylcarbamoyladenosine biosynthesis protein TsaB n=1 Tax=Kineobactrum salinum TaxID=2708301 RepID=A0A6C0TXF1_9GAMM|nr:tRNA (adenosine(37)-N6)-threonylcarbamoyltransferase complex dimerization subunit type 1 TsaB [Kineobactrum salinum]QIB64471.1 tRNA (adenosine(37)-N6)-threonylcarbamoyltransferase complex dimerization subunit type 1 TsaB [Kineobactrum salinum]